MSFQYIPFKEGPSEPRARSNQRVSVRYHCGPATAGRVNVAEKLEFLRAWVLDLSAQGVGLLVPRQLDLGQLVIITVKGTSNQRTYELPARVVHVTRSPQGEWVAGFALNDPLTSDDLDALL
jgi:PilZ domain